MKVITKELISFCQKTQFNDLSPDVIDKAKYFALDYLGIAARGMKTDSGTNIVDFIANNLKGTNETVIIGTSLKTPARYAAIANGVASHSLELDDLANAASLHPGTVIFSTIFALAPLVKATGKDIVLAAVLGYEAMIKIGSAVNPRSHYARGFHPTGTCGNFGAAVCAAKLLKLNNDQCMAAIGLAGSMASGSMQYLANGSWNKRFHPGWAAHNGILAAQMARSGFKGTVDALEGKFGFFHAYSDMPDPSKAIHALGNPFEITRTSVKPHACCRYNQAPIDCTIYLLEKYPISINNIREIRVALLKTAVPIVAEPLKEKRNPQSIVDAQFSLPFAIALAVCRGKATLDEYSMQNIGAREIRQVMKKVNYYLDETIEKKYPRKWPAAVIIIDRQGKEFSKKMDHPKGDPENPVTWDEMIEKFRSLISPLYSEKSIEAVIQEVLSLEKSWEPASAILHIMSAVEGSKLNQVV